VEIDFFDFGVGAHHRRQTPERNREHSIGDQVSALNVGFMERLHCYRIDRDLDQQARQQISLELGHNRINVITTYIGGRT
ncbi:hypothetical protein, partial [Pantoea sp. Ap-967]|uniref:hypothetical protein n=1 Tax=Pantoea sp. Ap-967 TaxID=2608362 RepID=UPI0019643BC9